MGDAINFQKDRTGKKGTLKSSFCHIEGELQLYIKHRIFIVDIKTVLSLIINH